MFFDTSFLPLSASIQRSLRELWRQPWLDMQMLLSCSALAFALLLSLLLQRVSTRKLKKRAAPPPVVTLLVQRISPVMLSPFLVIIMLAVAHSLMRSLTSAPPYIVAGCLKLALIWLVTRALLLVTRRHVMAYFLSIVMLMTALLSVTHLLAPTQAALNDIALETTNFRLSLLGVIKGVCTLILLFWGASLVSEALERWIRQLRISFNARELGVKFLRIFLYFTAFLLTLNQMGVDLTVLTVFGGALAVGAGLGLQRITSNFLSGIILLFEKTVEAGDLIEVGGAKGWVRKMAIRHTMIETPDGREMLIPNEELITSKVVNWTYTNTRARIQVALNLMYDTDIDMAEKLLLASAKSSPHCLSEPAPACYLHEFGERGMQFLLEFWIPDVQYGLDSAKSDVMFRIVRALRAHGIHFAVAPLEKT